MYFNSDVDAMFGNIAGALEKFPAYTLPGLFDAIRHATDKADILPFALGDLYDYKTWLEPHGNAFFNHSQPHIFR